jgi:hypothetical protein
MYYLFFTDEKIEVRRDWLIWLLSHSWELTDPELKFSDWNSATLTVLLLH